MNGHPPAEIDTIKCSACGFPCDIDHTPRGGQFYHQSATTVIGGVTVTYDNNGSQGCPFCGSPAWADGASLGDCAGWFVKH